MFEIFNKDISISWPMLIVIAASLFLSLSFYKDCSGKDNCSLLKLSYCASCGCNSFCSVSVRENVRAANLEYAIASFLKWVQLTQLRFVQRLRTHTHIHTHRVREGGGGMSGWVSRTLRAAAARNVRLGQVAASRSSKCCQSIRTKWKRCKWQHPIYVCN